MDQDRNPNLKNKAVFTKRKTVVGIPDRVFYATCLLVVFCAFVFVSNLGWVLGLLISLLFGAIVFVPVYLVHKDDPDGYLVWLGGIFAPTRLTASRVSARPLMLLSWNGDRSVVRPFKSNKGELNERA
jgi:hypothetical protein